MLVEPSGFRTDWAGRSSEKVLPEIKDYEQFKQFIVANTEGAHHEAGDQKQRQCLYTNKELSDR